MTVQDGSGAGRGTAPPQPVWDSWPLADIQHVPAPPTRFAAPLVLSAIAAALWFFRPGLSALPPWVFPVSWGVAGWVLLVRGIGFAFGRARRSPHRPRMLEPGRWLLSSWGRTQTFTPRAVYAPASLDELVAVVETCGRAGQTIKPAGSLHSWSACAVTDSVSVQMGRLADVLDADAERLTIHAEAGILLRDLYAHMERVGLALPCLPNVDTIQLGGAIANATHGTCIEAGSMCSLVTELEIVTFRPATGGSAADVRADGVAELVTLRRDSNDPHERHLFDAAVASFGSLGIIYALTLRCVPPYHSYVHELVQPFEQLANRFEALARQYYSVRFMWHPLADLVFTKIQVPIRGPLVRARTRTIATSLDLAVIKMVAFANERNPKRWLRLRRLLSRGLRWLVVTFRQELLQSPDKGGLLTWYDAELESRLHAAFVRHPFVNLEYAIPLVRCDETMNALRALFRRFPAQTMNAVGLRPVGSDDAGYLVATKDQAAVYVDLPYVADLERTGLYAAVERLCIARGGRCAWSRLIYSPPDQFLKNYPDHHRFVAAKRELDPWNVFSNAFSDRICFSQDQPTA
jgi:FAD/FMN-containing dehydrogenase